MFLPSTVATQGLSRIHGWIQVVVGEHMLSPSNKKSVRELGSPSSTTQVIYSHKRGLPSSCLRLESLQKISQNPRIALTSMVIRGSKQLGSFQNDLSEGQCRKVQKYVLV